MKETKIIYKCDICGQEVTKEIELIEREIPIKQSDCEGRSFLTSYKKVDMCIVCSRKYEEAVFNHFGIYRDLLGRCTFEKKGE